MKEKDIENKIKELKKDNDKTIAEFWKEAIELQAMLKANKDTENKEDNNK